MTKNHIKNFKKIFLVYNNGNPNKNSRRKRNVHDLLMKNEINGMDLSNALIHLKVLLEG